MATENNGARETAAQNRDVNLADEYLTDQVYVALLERGEASKVSEIALEIANPRLSVALVRRALGDEALFVSVDRQWNLASRYLGTSRTTERNLVEIVQAAGRPLSTSQVASELSVIYHKPSESYFGLINRVAASPSFFKTAASELGLSDWLPVIGGETETDVLSENGYKAAAVAQFRRLPAQKEWSAKTYAQTTRKIVEAAKRDLPHRFVGLLAYLQMGGAYDARAHFAACYADRDLCWIPGRGKTAGRWITRVDAERLERLLEEQGATLANSADVEEVPEPVETPAETLPEPVAATIVAAPAPEPAAPEVVPLAVTPDDLAAIEHILSARGTAVETSELLGLRYEVLPGDPSYRSDVETLAAGMKASVGFLYVGAGRFRLPDALPAFVYDIPEFLQFPDLQFVSMDGEIMDEVISDEGFVGTLRADLLNPLAQDVGDDEATYTGTAPEPGSPIRLVVKSHHRDYGTFPLCQVPDGFFPADAPVVEVVVRTPDGQTQDVIVNNDKHIAFGFSVLYELLPAGSGATFQLFPTARPFEFRFEAGTDLDVQTAVAPDRVTELAGLREAIDEGAEMATFDITCEVLAYHQKGADFVQTLTEINLIRRVTRRKLASILSNYLCFMQKAGTNQWRFDPRRRDYGTDRDKRKYLKR